MRISDWSSDVCSSDLALVDEGADVLLIGSAWVAGEHKSGHWRTLLKARAIENTSYVIASNQPGHSSVGGSMIVDPYGEIIAECTSKAGLAIADLSFEHHRKVRRLVTCIKHPRYRNVPCHAESHESRSKREDRL